MLTEVFRLHNVWVIVKSIESGTDAGDAVKKLVGGMSEMKV
jgi:hypothetical protein